MTGGRVSNFATFAVWLLDTGGNGGRSANGRRGAKPRVGIKVECACVLYESQCDDLNRLGGREETDFVVFT